MNEVIETLEKAASGEIIREGYSLNEDGVASWLAGKNIISPNEKISSYRDLKPWFRAGGESYITIFEFTTLRVTKRIVIKAIVTLFPEKSFSDWSRRRSILKENGIPVSNWYFTSKGTIYEDYYPFTAKERVNFESLLAIGQRLDFLGFTTLKFIDDIRADDYGNPYFIDFGFDLGESSNEVVLSAKEYLIQNFPEKILEINAFYGKNKSL